MPVVAALPAIIGAGASIGGSVIASKAAGNAANTQAGAANYAADLNKQASDAALAEQQRQFNTNQQNLQPYLNTGYAGLANLGYLLGVTPRSGTTGGTTSDGNGGYAPAQETQAAGAAISPDQQSRIDQLNQEILTRQNILGGLGGGTFKPGESPHSADTINKINNEISQEQSMLTDLRAQAGLGPDGKPLQVNKPVDLQSMVNPSLGDYGSLYWKPPTEITEQNDPGYQARLDEAQKALKRAQTAGGVALTAGAAKSLMKNSQDYASNEYGNVYNRALNDYNTRYNSLAGLAGTGQLAANSLGTLGQNFANSSSSILTNSANQQGNDLQNAAAAWASGYVGSANAINQGISGGVSSLQDIIALLGKNNSNSFSNFNNNNYI